MKQPKDRILFGPDPRVVAGEWQRLSELVKVDPEGAWTRLIEISRIADDASLYWVADIAEDLVIKDAETFVPRIDAEASSNERFRRALIDLTPTAANDGLNDRLLALRRQAEVEFGVSDETDLAT